MESSLHRAYEDHYGSGSGGRSEVALEGYRIDAVDARGTLVEIQSGPLGRFMPSSASSFPVSL